MSIEYQVSQIPQSQTIEDALDDWVDGKFLPKGTIIIINTWGMHLAERNMFLSIAKLLWAFRFENGVRADGGEEVNETDPVEGYHQGFLYCAKPYGCTPVVRSEEHRETILREFEEAEKSIFSIFEEG